MDGGLLVGIRISHFLKPTSNKSYFKLLFNMFLIFQVILLFSNIIIFVFIKQILAKNIKAYNTNAIYSIKENIEDTFMEMNKICTSAMLPAKKMNEIRNADNLKPEDYLELGDIKRDFLNLFSIRRSYDKWFYYNGDKEIILDASGVYKGEEYLNYYYSYQGQTLEEIKNSLRGKVEQAKILPVTILYEKQLMHTLGESVVPFIYSYRESTGQSSVVVINYSTKSLEKITSGHLISDEMSILITDQNGNLLSISGSFREEEIAYLRGKKFEKNELMLEQKKIRGEKYVVMSQAIEYPNWTIHISLPYHLFYKQSNTIFVLLMLANFSMALVGGGVAYGFSRRLFSPIYNLFSVLYPQKQIGRSGCNQNEFELIRTRLEEINQSNFNFRTKMRYMEPIFTSNFLMKVLEEEDFLEDEKNIAFLQENTSLVMDSPIYLCDVRFAFQPYFIKKLSIEEKEEMYVNLQNILTSMLTLSAERVISVYMEADQIVFFLQNISDGSEEKLLKAVDDLRRLFIYDTDTIRISFMVGKAKNVLEMSKIYTQIEQNYMHIPISNLFNQVWAWSYVGHRLISPKISWDKLGNIMRIGDLDKVKSFLEEEVNKIKFELTIKIMEVIYSECLQFCREALEQIDQPCNQLDWFEEILLSQIFSDKEFLELLQKMVILVFEKIEKEGGSRGEEFFSYIHTNYKEENISLDVMADYFNISPNYLSKIFKEETGVSFTDYLASYRIKKSKELLLNTNMSIGDIATAVGIANRVTFNRLFNKIEGIAPSQYRNIHSIN